MIQLRGIESKFPTNDLRKVADLIYFDGPFLSHYVSKSGDNYLSYWVDCDESNQRWLVFRVGINSLQNYVNKKKSLYELINGVDDGFVYAVDISEDGTQSVPLMTFLADIPDEYLPTADSYFDFSYEKESDVAALSMTGQCGLFEIHFTGSDVKYGTMPFEKYTKCLLKVEELRQSCAKSFIKKIKSSENFKKLDSKKQNQKLNELFLDTNFEYVYSLAGSVRVLLRPQNLQVSFTETSADDFARELIRLFKSGYSETELRKYAEEYGQEALVKFNELLQLLKKNKVNIAVSWTNANQHIQEGQKIEEKDKQHIIENLAKSIEQTEDMPIKGKFYLLNTRTGSFAFESIDDEKLSISGKFDDTILDRIQSLTFEQVYEITVERRIYIGFTKSHNPKYIIYDIKEL